MTKVRDGGTHKMWFIIICPVQSYYYCYYYQDWCNTYLLHFFIIIVVFTCLIDLYLCV